MWIALLSCSLLQAGEPPAELGREGPLQNETVLLVHAAAQEEIERGDRSWSRGDEVEAFEAWRRALETSETGDAVLLVSGDADAPRPWADVDATHARRSEGVEYAVLRRLSATPPQTRAEWRARFEPLAERALARTGDDPRWLARVERDWPLTAAAAVAALRLADLALEADESLVASAWLERAARHAAVLDPPFVEAIARRSALAARLSLPPSRASGPEAWESARTLVPVGAVRLSGVRMGTRSPYDRAPLGRSIEPGAAFLDDGTMVIVVPLWFVRIHLDGRVERFLGGPLFGLPEELQPFVSPTSAGWPLCTTTDGQRVFWVEGRAGEEHDNALVSLGFDRSGAPLVPWVLSEQGLAQGERTRPRAEILGTGRWSFQPGPLVHGKRLYVQARETSASEEGEAGTGETSWLVCLDATRGVLLWKRALGRPSDLVAGRERRPTASIFTSTPGMPLAAAGTRIFAGTNAGYGVLVDALDGRIAWAFKNRRRDPADEGWPGTRRPEVEPADGGASVIHWAPFDSDVAYVLRAEPDLGAGVLAAPPRRRGEALDLFGAAGNRTLGLADVEGRRALVEWTGDASIHSLWLRREERFTGAGLARAERALFASDRALYLFDRTRELSLVAAPALTDERAGRGGSVLARGARVWVLGTDTLWTFEAR